MEINLFLLAKVIHGKWSICKWLHHSCGWSTFKLQWRRTNRAVGRHIRTWEENEEKIWGKIYNIGIYCNIARLIAYT